MKTIAIMNNKGGVGKTITAINLADILVRDHGKRVVLCDCDGQMNLTRFYLPGFDEDVHFTTAALLLGDGEQVWSDNLMPISPGLDLIPGSTALYEMDLEAIRYGAHNAARLREFVEAAREDDGADFFIFDCPPGFTLASVGALMAADEVIVPLTVDGFSIEGLETMEKQLRAMRRTGVKLSGVLITQWHSGNAVRQGEQLLREAGFPVFQTTIRRTVKVTESTMMRQPLAEYSPKGTATQDYRKWVNEWLGGAHHGV